MLKVAILCGGLATRLYPLTESIPKSMIVIKGKPFLEYQIRLLKEQGVNEVVLLTGHLSPQIEKYFADGSDFGLKITYSRDGEIPQGTGGALLNALPLLGDHFFVMYGDSYLRATLGEISDYFIQNYQNTKNNPALGLMTIFKNNNQFDRSNILYKDGRILRYDKTTSDPNFQYIDWGLGLLSANAFENFKKNQKHDLSEIYQQLLKNHQLLGYEVKDRFYEIGSHNGLKDFSDYIAQQKL